MIQINNDDNKFKKGIVFDVQRFSIHDGLGIRTLVFMKGCPLKCLWCSNPESQKIKPETAFIKNNCIKCGSCYSECEEKAIGKEDFDIDRNLCINCGRCETVCPTNTKKTIGYIITVEKLFEKIDKDRIFYRNSEGGVTVGGGEPTVQPEFVASFLKMCKDNNVHTSIETCGYAKWRDVESIIENVDSAFFDIKCMDNNKHKILTGVENGIILDNIAKAAEKIPVTIRTPIIPGYNDYEENLIDTINFSSQLKKINGIEFLMYHSLGVYKYDWIGREYSLFHIKQPDDKYKEKIKEITNGVKTKLKIKIV